MKRIFMSAANTIAGLAISIAASTSVAACGDNPSSWRGAGECGRAAAENYPAGGQGMAMEAVESTIKNKILKDDQDK